MASREGLVYKFFRNWKTRRLNRVADKLVKDNPVLEQALRNLDSAAAKVSKQIRDATK